jgi:type II secretory pathway component PulF
MRYTYRAKSIRGETSSGMLVADSLALAQQQLRQQGLFPMSLAPAARQAAQQRSFSLPFRRRRVSRKDLMALTSQLAIMTKAGIDVAGAIQSLARQCPNPALKATLESVHQDIMSGKPVSVALRNQGHVFGEAYVASIAAGEASGRLSEVLARLAAMARAELRQQSTRRALMAYPIVLASVSLLVILGLMFFVLPQFAGVFDRFGMPLPMITQVLLGISHELRSRWWLWIGLAAGAIFGFTAWRKSPSGKKTWDHMLVHAVVIRNITRSLVTGRAFRLLGIMLESGVPLIEALRLTRSSIQNSVFRDLFDRLEREVLNGRPLAEALATAPFVPNGATEMVSTAERTGTLAMVTQVIGEFYEEEGETRLRELATMIEPLVIVVMGVVVACVVLSVMLPMFEFATFAQQGA